MAARYFRDIKEAEKFLFDALASSDDNLLTQWCKHFHHFFPPLLYLHSASILSRCRSVYLKVYIIKSIFVVDPELASYSIASDDELKAPLIGRSLYSQTSKVARNGTILIYSDKLSESFVSSQECFKPIISELVKRYPCILIADSKCQISESYQALAPCIHVDTTEPELLSNSLKEIRSNNPVLYMPITRNDILESQLSEVPIFSCFPMDYIGSLRAPDYRLRSKVTDRCTFPYSLTKLIGEVPLPVFPPPESNNRRYKARNTSQSAAGGHARFGAFCRLAKLDVAMLTTWSITLKAIKHSKLYFSYIQTSKIS